MTNIFSHVDDDTREKVSRNLESVEFNDGQRIVKQGDAADAFFIIKADIKKTKFFFIRDDNL